MKCTKIILSGLVAFAATANAMPTQEETKKVEPLVMDLMRDDQAALKSGKKTRAEVAESAMELANQAESEAAKLLLMKGAFNLYVRAGEFDKAIETLHGLQTAIPDMPPADMAKIIESSLRAVPRKNGGQLYRMLGEIKARSRYTDELKALESSVKKTPADRSLRLKLAEHYAFLGDWDRALENFAATDGKVGEIAKAERDGNGATKKVADFWWDYPTNHAKDKSDELERCFHAHAAKLYEDAIASDDIKGLNKVQAERRIEETKGYGECDVQLLVKERVEEGLYMIVDLTKTGNGAVSYLDAAPKDGWSDEYRTKKMVLRRIEPGSFECLSGKSFKITKPFYIGVFEVTQKQYEMTMKANPSEFKGDMRPVERVGYLDIRGSSKGLTWPKANNVDDDSYLGKLRKRIGLEFDLPTEVQWEYACRAGTMGDLNVDGVEMVKLGKCRENGGVNDKHAKVGSFLPNAWGLYDMYGNVWEWCLDRWTDRWTADAKETDPKGPAEEGPLRVRRSGCMFDAAHRFRPSLRGGNHVAARSNFDGFRLVCPAEKSDSRKNNGFAEIKELVANVGGYTWSCRVSNGEAMIFKEANGSGSCAVSPMPTGNVSIPASLGGVKVTGIGEHAFFGCSRLTSVTIPSGVKSIDNGAFYYCGGIKSFKIPSSVTDIVPTAFTAIKSVQSFSVDINNPSYSSRNGLLCSKDGSLLLAGVNGDVTIPSGVVTIGRQSFLGRGLPMTVVIPSSVKNVEERAFAYCPELTSVTMRGERPDAPNDIFQHCVKLKSIHVPANAKSWAGMKDWHGIPLVFDAK